MNKTLNTVPVAYIAIGRNRQKVYGKDTIYLTHGTEFEIELFNPTSNVVGAEIFLNGNSISSSLIVLKPGQRYFLERYIDNNRKFLFDTYEVERTEEVKKAIQSNGTVVVKFYNEKIKDVRRYDPIISTPPPYNPFTTPSYPGTTLPYYYTTNAPIFGSLTTNICNDTTFTSCSNDVNFSDNISEKTLSFGMASLTTGRVEEGTTSKQGFDNYNGSFNMVSVAQSEYKLIPVQEKPIETQDIRKYCTGCGIRVRKQSWQFCPSCGREI